MKLTREGTVITASRRNNESVILILLIHDFDDNPLEESVDETSTYVPVVMVYYREGTLEAQLRIIEQ